MKNMLPTLVVMPCLNEEENILETARSLGFGLPGNNPPEKSVLIIVDNGSTDNSLSIADKIINTSGSNNVVVVNESERGFVPARHSGNLKAREIAKSRGWNEENSLIIQVDADTIYSSLYIEEMRIASDALGAGIMVQAISEYPKSFKDRWGNYVELCERVDAEFAEYLEQQDLDPIKDDKVVGYRLKDYFEWGGHRREYDASGEEIFSETSRLFLSALSLGAKSVVVDSALAQHSVRKILADPLLDLATAGFPRSRSWISTWHESHPPVPIEELNLSDGSKSLRHSIAVRRNHILGLFGLLPLHVARAIRERIPIEKLPGLSELSAKLPERTTEILRSRPGVFLEDILGIVDARSRLDLT
jgi:hypothetical protein